MKLYHGSNVEVRTPQILVSNRALDFGAGFYTTSSLEQAEKWAFLQAKRRRKGEPIVSVYEFDSKKLSPDLEVLEFKSADEEWLKFVVDNRKKNYSGKKYDIIIGPVANDNTMPVINDFMMGNINKETALLLLKPQKLKNQYAFTTMKSINLLKEVEVKRYE